MKTVCIYHDADLDGVCSGAIVKRFYPECVMIGADYGKEIDLSIIEKDDRVIVVDFCLEPFSRMADLQTKCADFIWIDHHVTAIADADKCPGFSRKGKQSLEKAACELCWEYFYGEDEVQRIRMPSAVYLLGRYDIWKHQDVPNVLEFQYGMRTYCLTPTSDIWERLFLHDKELERSICFAGDAALAFAESTDKKYAEAFSFPVTLAGRPAIACNKIASGSALFKSVWDPAKYDFVVSFGMHAPFKWKVSLYTDKEGVDVSQIAKAHGGGGHKQAAGFECESLAGLFE